MARGGLRGIEKRWKRASGRSWGTNSTKLARWLNLVHGDLDALLRVAKASRDLVDLLETFKDEEILRLGPEVLKKVLAYKVAARLLSERPA